MTIGLIIIIFLGGVVVGGKIQRYIITNTEKWVEEDQLHYEEFPCRSDDHFRYRG